MGMFVRASGSSGSGDAIKTLVTSRTLASGNDTLSFSSNFSKVHMCYIHRANYLAIGALTGTSFGTFNSDANVASSLKVTGISGTTVSYFCTSAGSATVYVVGTAK